MHRLFVGIPLPEAIGDALIDTMDGIENARWQSDAQLHLTLRFIGEVDRPLANDVADALSRVVQDAFPLRFEGIGHFARKGRATAVWAGVPRCDPLLTLQRKVEQACRAAGCEPETRRFMPHVTLARLNLASGSIGDFLRAHATLRTPQFEVDRFVLYESHLSRGGSHYEPAVSYPMR
ncbi:RNA 2',3'-cyclic phosphodiesterase [Croceicoccus sp. YJ47]|uniref:RNA 2',3'-cyclic phosphodiesterase n=1 Tax=Croceicoccus sp. YJ47 TaxID=2798724 RepID=UPI001923BEE3|nr:RNA 2',3'-cyclic phosphodiesterase [Croceicoccus sp. YJ47]QQN73521.1 RNA 2',3'-cyclic phosphodiesterase [Croceicoccus sp. YJ47]